jgi:hypothetical protein
MVSLVGGGIVDLFPKIRFGLLETGCGWLPYWIEPALRSERFVE